MSRILRGSSTGNPLSPTGMSCCTSGGMKTVNLGADTLTSVS